MLFPAEWRMRLSCCWHWRRKAPPPRRSTERPDPTTSAEQLAQQPAGAAAQATMSRRRRSPGRRSGSPDRAQQPGRWVEALTGVVPDAAMRPSWRRRATCGTSGRSRSPFVRRRKHRRHIGRLQLVPDHGRGIRRRRLRNSHAIHGNPTYAGDYGEGNVAAWSFPGRYLDRAASDLITTMESPIHFRPCIVGTHEAVVCNMRSAGTLSAHPVDGTEAAHPEQHLVGWTALSSL